MAGRCMNCGKRHLAEHGIPRDCWAAMVGPQIVAFQDAQAKKRLLDALTTQVAGQIVYEHPQEPEPLPHQDALGGTC